jgi:CRP-like cAMP-binding protein
LFEVLKKNIDKRIKITDNEFETCTKFFEPRRIKKRQFLLHEREVAKYIAFVNSGCLRSYTIDHLGNEHVIQFAVKDWWIADMSSYLSGLPSTFNIDALQDCDVLLLETSKREELLATVPKFERYFRLLMEANYIATHKRINESLSTSAEERYLNFIKNYPNLLEQIPQNQIASYLGITPQSLSRIRKELTKKR